MWTVSKRSQLGRMIVISVVFTILCFNYMLTQVQASPSGTTSVSDLYPSLFVTKDVDNSEVTLNESFVVTITITNFGNSTAYNITFIDTLNSPWVFKTTGLTELTYSWIEPNQTRRFSYIVTALSVGEYELHSAKVYYRISDLVDTEFLAYSNSVYIVVNQLEEDFSLENFNSAVTFLLVLIVLNIVLTLRLIAPRFNRRKS